MKDLIINLIIQLSMMLTMLIEDLDMGKLYNLKTSRLCGFSSHNPLGLKPFEFLKYLPNFAEKS